jgi:hypothetical protein
MFAGHGELVDKRELKTAQAFDPRIASGFTESRSAATRDSDCGSAEERVSNNEILGGIWIHKAQIVRLSILRQLASPCQDMKRLCAATGGSYNKPGYFIAYCSAGRIIE